MGESIAAFSHLINCQTLQVKPAFCENNKMEEFLDIIWFKIVGAIGYLVELSDMALAPLNPLGPATIILILALATVCFTKWFSRIYTTRRYETLKKEFTHWFNLRQEALACKDREKGKLLAKNIDQAKLNKVYYDYFFEGFLKNILTTYLPGLIMAAYINESFRSEILMAEFGSPYIFRFAGSGGTPVAIGGLFWFVISLLGTYMAWGIAKKFFSKENKGGSSQPSPTVSLPSSPHGEPS